MLTPITQCQNGSLSQALLLTPIINSQVLALTEMALTYYVQLKQHSTCPIDTMPIINADQSCSQMSINANFDQMLVSKFNVDQC